MGRMAARGPEGMYLENAQEELLSWMVEAERSLPVEHRGPFFLIQADGDAFLVHSYVVERPHVRKGDLETLAEERLLRRDFGGSGTPAYEVTPLGRRYDAERKRSASEATTVVEDQILHYLDSDLFRVSFHDAYERWREAAEALWAADDEAQFTQIGHLCREAMQAFASSVTSATHVIGVPDDPTKTVARIRAALGTERVGSPAAFLDALLAYWGVTNDLVQRQEHGAQKEGESLGWEDARRVVFQTAIVMFEVARAVSLNRAQSDAT
jgi:hypothetical protein